MPADDTCASGAFSRGRRRQAIALALACAFAVAPVGAQERGGGIPVGEAKAYPALRIDYTADDNVYADDDDPTRGTSIAVSPSVELLADRRQLTFRAFYRGAWSKGSEDVLDVLDHLLRVDVGAVLDKRRRVNAFARYARAHQALGFGLTRGRERDLDEPVVFDQVDLNGSFRYGVTDARGNVEAGLNVQARSYVNLDEITDGRDFTEIQPFGLFSYRLSSDSRALIELRYTSFADDAGLYDRDETSLFGGFEFLATGRLRGAARLGATHADYASATRDDLTILSAQADVAYLLRDYVTLGLTFERSLDDATSGTGETTQAIEDILRLSWEHTWSSRLSHDAYVEFVATEDACPTGDSGRVRASYELNLGVRRWLEFGAGFLAERREGEDCESDTEGESLDFERRAVGVHVRATL